MVDFSNSNLCGASPELNDVLSKLDSAKADVKSKLDATASSAAAAFSEAQNELAGLKGKLQSIEIPTLPKLNLQAEIASLASLIPGTPSFLSALAKIKTEFGDDIKSAGLELDSLVSDATKSILGGGDVCALVPNLQKEAGSDVPAVEEPAAVKSAAAKATTELPSVSNQNATIVTKTEEIEEKTKDYAVTNEAPTEDTGAYVVSQTTQTVSITKTETTGGGSTIVRREPAKVSPPEPQANVANPETEGFVDRPTRQTDRIKFENLEISGDKITIKGLTEKPQFVTGVFIYPGANPNFLVQPKDSRIKKGPLPNMPNNEFLALKAVFKKEGQPPYYNSDNGDHLITILGRRISRSEVGNRKKVEGLGEGGEKATINSDGSVTVFSYQGVPDGNHPGNIISTPLLGLDSGILSDKTGIVSRAKFGENPRGIFRNENGDRRSDRKFNRRYGGFAVEIVYVYLDNYNPDKKA
jgi:hypothetical protein